MTVMPIELSGVIQPLRGERTDFDPLIERIGNAQFVLLGEASHGTHEFYHCRAAITRRLIEEHGFTAVAVEADWPDAYRVNEYVRNEGTDNSAAAALSEFKRFPQWMWRNLDVLSFVQWLRSYNDSRASSEIKAGFYGLDLYSMHSSMAAVLEYLESADADAAKRARARYSCFDHFGPEPQAYGYAASLGVAPSCERQALAQLLDLQRSRGGTENRARGTTAARDRHFFAEQNARLVSNAERYYRMMFTEGARSWNFRDRHMMETLVALTVHLEETTPTPPRIVVWAHNSHLGDARATDMSRRGELNLGQLVREHYATDSVLVGFTTYTGTVTAARDWDAPGVLRQVVPGRKDSYEGLLHEVAEGAGTPDFYLDLSRHEALHALGTQRLERAIGVIYRPESERQSHYFPARIVEQFDALFHFDKTHAVVPLDASAGWSSAAASSQDVPDTFPSAL